MDIQKVKRIVDVLAELDNSEMRFVRQLVTNGESKPRMNLAPKKITRKTRYIKVPNSFKSWEEDELKLLFDMKRLKVPSTQISKKLGRSQSSVDSMYSLIKRGKRKTPALNWGKFGNYHDKQN